MGKLRQESNKTHLRQQRKLGLTTQAVPFPTFTYISPTAMAKLHIFAAPQSPDCAKPVASLQSRANLPAPRTHGEPSGAARAAAERGIFFQLNSAPRPASK